MKNRKAVKLKSALSAILAVMLAAVLVTALSGCMKIGMRKDKILERLNKESYAVEYLSTAPWLSGSASDGITIREIIRARKAGEEDAVNCVYIQFAGNSKSADWVEERCKNYKPEEGAEGGDFKVYRYENVILFGNYPAMSIARGY